MDIKDIQKRISELKAAQSNYFKKKKADRLASEIETIRAELNSLKAKLKNL